MFKHLTWKQWLLCQFAALGAGWLAWSASENAWVGGGVAVGMIVGITFFLAGRTPDQPAGRRAARPGFRGRAAKAAEPPAPLTRQQRRAMQRSEKKRSS